MPILLTLIVIAILIALTSSRLSKERGSVGIAGWIRDQDLDGHGRRYYFNRRFGIGCKPDIKESRRIIEYKSASAGSSPYPADLMQLAGEMIATGVDEAELRYGNGRTYPFDSNSPEMKEAMQNVQQIVGQMQFHLKHNIMPKGTPTPKRCARCSFGKECDQSACG
jgi:CRISPR/Cas system-associated exonuclease Cas4 (RecB family)